MIIGKNEKYKRGTPGTDKIIEIKTGEKEEGGCVCTRVAKRDIKSWVKVGGGGRG